MEKILSTQELLSNLLKSARDPFCRTERIIDIHRILRDSGNFDGINHLLLAEAYLNPYDYPFNVTKEEALDQIQKAIEEGNHNGYYYRYLLIDDAQEKRKCLEVASFYGYPKAILEIARCYREGILFEKDDVKAYAYYKIAAHKGEAKGYLGMMLIDIDHNDMEQQKTDYEQALSHGIRLPGVVH